MGIQILSLVGAFLILSAYVANQRGWMGPEHRSYALINLVGALALGRVAVVDNRWGFILLEAIWVLVSIPPLIRPRPATP